MSARILKIESLNLRSKRAEQQTMIFNIYEQLLNSLQTAKVQILCKSEEFDIRDYDVDSQLYDFFKDINRPTNKTFYLIISGKSSVVDANINVITRYFIDMNIHCEEIKENSYKWNKVLEMNKNYVKDEQFYYKTMYVKDWPSYCTPGWLEFLYNSDLNIDVNCYITPMQNIKSIKLLRKKLIQFGVSTELELERTNDDTMYSAELESIDYMLDEIRSNTGKLFLLSFYITVKGKTTQELNENYEIVKNFLNSKSIDIASCYLFQHEAYKNNTLDCNDNISKNYNMTTSTLKCFFPFQYHNICDRKGVYIGVNQQNNSLLFLDIFARQYAVMLIMGIMGSGKSFLAKNIIMNLSKTVEITILDKSGEYSIFKDYNNIIVHSNKTMKEYIQITKEYNNKINEEYKNKQKMKPRLFIVDELPNYIDSTSNEFADEFNGLFSEMILEGRKKYLALLFMCQIIESLINNKAGQTIMKTANIRFLMKMTYNESKMIAEELDLNQQQINFLTTANHEGLMMVNANCVRFKVELPEQRKMLFNTDPTK